MIYFDTKTSSYHPDTSVTFLRTTERFGWLSNMAAGFPMRVNGLNIKTSEALYQALRFPNHPEIQTKILAERSPMSAKMVSKPYRQSCGYRYWDDIRLEVMWWCLRVKLVTNWENLSAKFNETGEKPIVEISKKDTFWGAKYTTSGELVGQNVLGKLLMELRTLAREGKLINVKHTLTTAEALELGDFVFMLNGRKVYSVEPANGAKSDNLQIKLPLQ